MNWVDWLRTSADKRMWSGRRAVVMVRLVAVGCGCSAFIRRSSLTGDWATGHEGYPPPDCSGQEKGRAAWRQAAWREVGLPAQSLPRHHFRHALHAMMMIAFIITLGEIM